MELDQEKFDELKELTEISQRVSDLRVLLTQLEGNKDAFLDARENDVKERIEFLLVRSSDAIKQIGENHDELVKCRRSLEEYHAELRHFHERVVALQTDFEEYFAEQNAGIDEKLKKIEDLETENKRERSLMDAERMVLEEGKKKLAEDQRLANDRQQLLDRNFKRLNKLQNKT